MSKGLHLYGGLDAIYCQKELKHGCVPLTISEKKKV